VWARSAMAELRDLRVHACALNARDLDSLASHALRSAPCICDGEWVGEGPDGVRKALEKEFAMNEEAFARLGTVDGELAVLEYDGAERAVEPRAILRFVGGEGGRIHELRIDHGSHGSPSRRPVVRLAVDEPSP
jgi:hypothetical protein